MRENKISFLNSQGQFFKKSKLKFFQSKIECQIKNVFICLFSFYCQKLKPETKFISAINLFYTKFAI